MAISQNQNVPTNFAEEPKNVDPLLLWHEMIHAVSHQNVEDGGVTFSYIEPVAKEKDHLYVYWAESCAKALPSLVAFENIIKQGGRNPWEQQLAEAQQQWRVFYDATQVSAYDENKVTVLPTDSQKDELQRMIGFHLDPQEIMNRYVGLDYMPEYFRASPTLNLWIPRPVLDVTNYPGESTDVTIRFNDPADNRQYGWIDYEYEIFPGTWAEITGPEKCPCEMFITKTLYAYPVDSGSVPMINW